MESLPTTTEPYPEDSEELDIRSTENIVEATERVLEHRAEVAENFLEGRSEGYTIIEEDPRKVWEFEYRGREVRLFNRRNRFMARIYDQESDASLDDLELRFMESQEEPEGYNWITRYGPSRRALEQVFEDVQQI